MNNPDDRAQFFVTADAIVIHESKVLLIKRRPQSRAFPGYYAFPGGHAEHSEDLETAVLRELEEETGIRGTIIDLVGVYSKPRRDPRGAYVGAAYLIKPDSLMAIAADDAVDARWFDIKDAMAMSLAFDHNKMLSDAVNRVEFAEFLQLKGLV